MVHYDLRPATETDRDLLIRLGHRFEQGPESNAVRGWMHPQQDFGVVAVSTSGHDVGAAWWRTWWAIDAQGIRHEAISPSKEAFLSIEEGTEGRGMAGALLDVLIICARADPRLTRLAGVPVQGARRAQVIRMLENRGFVRNLETGLTVPVWTLEAP